MKKTWSEGEIKEVGNLFTSVIPKITEFSSIVECDINNVFQYNAEKNDLIFSSSMCNHIQLPDFVVVSVLAFICAACAASLSETNNIQLTYTYAKKLCDRYGVKFVDDDSCEEYIRPVRRKLFSDPLKNGCYFSIGDIVRAKPGGGPHRYKVVDITKSEETDEAIVTIRALDNKNNKSFTYKEAELYNYYKICWED